jgi:carboxymethylenebutenolidase
MNVVKGLTLVAMAIAGIAGVVHVRAVSATVAPTVAPAMVHSALPSAAEAKMLLNMTTRHREWIVVPISKETSVLAWVVYPERSDRAQVVMLKGETLNPSDWTRAVSDQLSAEGYLTVVPDVLTEVDSRGNRHARGALDASEIERREQAIRRAALQLPDADRSLGTVELVASPNQIRVRAKQEQATFALSTATWPTVVRYLNERTGNAPMFVQNPHAMHMAMMAQAAAGNIPAASDIAKKDPRLPANYFMAKAAIRDSKLKAEWVDLPLEGQTVKLHTLVIYPTGTAKTGVVIVMQHGVGVDEWQRALAYQIAEDGFIAVLPDLWSGTGPNGGNWDASEFVDDAVRNAAGKVSPEEGMRRYKTAREWALKLPRANGKSGSIGFCMGGGNSFRFATEVPELNAAVVYYGGAPTTGRGGPPNETLLANVKAPILGLYGENDGRMAEDVAQTKIVMTRLGKPYEAHVYPKTTHSFAMFQHIGTNAASIADAWPRTIAFFKKNLS